MYFVDIAYVTMKALRHWLWYSLLYDYLFSHHTSLLMAGRAGPQQVFRQVHACKRVRMGWDEVKRVSGQISS